MIAEQDLISKLILSIQANTEALNKVKISVPPERELWTAEQCAEYLSIDSPRSFTEYTAARTDFPDAVPIPSIRSSVRCSRRWVAQEVQDWALSNRDKLADRRKKKR